MKFAIFILTHGRPDNQVTLQTLQRTGYTGEWYLVVDNEDKTINEYIDRYGEHIIVFDKEQFINNTDTAEREPKRNFAVFARNAIEYIAKELGYDYFGMFDDDIMNFRHRYEVGTTLCSYKVSDIDSVLAEHILYMQEANLATMSFGINTNFMFGTKRDLTTNTYRMCFNSYIRCAKYEVKWSLNMWEDVITSAVCNNIGQVWIQSPCIQMDMSPIGENNKGGNSEEYRNTALLHQIFYTQLARPDCFRIGFKRDKMMPITKYDKICSKILSSGYKKERK